MADIINHPLIADQCYMFELANDHFIRIDLRTNANGDWTVEHLDHTGEFVCGLQIPTPEDD